MKHTISVHVFFILSLGIHLVPEKEDKQRKGFDADALGFLYMLQPPDQVKEVLGDRWKGLNRIWKVVEQDYELRQAREEILHWFEMEYSEKLRSLSEWREYLKEVQTKSG